MKNRKNWVLALATLQIVTMGSMMSAVEKDGLLFNSIRSLGMGNAGVAGTYSEHALYKNPAGLAYARSTLKLPRLRLEAGQGVTTLVPKLMDLSKETDNSKQDEQLRNLVPFEMATSVAFSPIVAWTETGFAVAGFSDSQFYANVDKQLEGEISHLSDLGAGVGFARNFDFFGTLVDIGLSSIYVHRMSVYNDQTGETHYTIGPSDLVKLIDGDLSLRTFNRSGFVVNAGFLTDFNTGLGKGKWGVAVNNLMGSLTGIQELNSVATHYKGTLPTTATIGTTLVSDVPLIGTTEWAVDYKFISPSKSLFKNLHMGAEKKIWDNVFHVRLGINQGYFVGGIGLDLGFIRLDYVKYTQEAGSEIGIEPRDAQAIEIALFF